VKNGITIIYHVDGKSVFAKGKTKGGKPEGYWEWFRKDGTLKRSGDFKDGRAVEWLGMPAWPWFLSCLLRPKSVGAR
jgi:antitoxin component YwqK of YwqJK toxin-antitoxin module